MSSRGLESSRVGGREAKWTFGVVYNHGFSANDDHLRSGRQVSIRFFGVQKSEYDPQDTPAKTL